MNMVFEIGSLEVRKKASLVLVDLSQTHTMLLREQTFTVAFSMPLKQRMSA